MLIETRALLNTHHNITKKKVSKDICIKMAKSLVCNIEAKSRIKTVYTIFKKKKLYYLIKRIILAMSAYLQPLNNLQDGILV